MTPNTHSSAPLTVAAFQAHIADLYLPTDKARGPAKTFLYLAEEFGELATAIAHSDKHPAGHPEHVATRKNLEEEFADVIAWLCSIANTMEVDLTQAINDKYFGEKRPVGAK